MAALSFAGICTNAGERHTVVSISGDEFHINGQPTYAGRKWNGHTIQGLLRVKNSTRDGRRLLVSTSYGGGTIPKENVVRASDFLLIHGNGVSDSKKISEMLRLTRLVPGYHAMPILFNEDDHFDFDKTLNNFTAAVAEHASWGFFDYRMKNEGFDEGYQSVPVNWKISSERKRGFFKLLREITGQEK